LDHLRNDSLHFLSVAIQFCANKMCRLETRYPLYLTARDLYMSEIVTICRTSLTQHFWHFVFGTLEPAKGEPKFGALAPPSSGVPQSRISHIKARSCRNFLAPFSWRSIAISLRSFGRNGALRFPRDCPAPLAWVMERMKISRSVSSIVAESGPISRLEHTGCPVDTRRHGCGLRRATSTAGKVCIGINDCSAVRRVGPEA